MTEDQSHASQSNAAIACIQPSLYEAALVWLKIGLLSFGGPAAQIALMHRVLVEEKGWINDKDFLHSLSFCMLLPGPEAMQQATYVGWRLHGTVGGLVAGLLFTLPGALVMLAIAMAYVMANDLSLMTALLFGIKAAVLVIVIQALIRVSKKALRHKMHWYIAALSFVGLFFFYVPFPLIVISSGLLGFAITNDQKKETDAIDFQLNKTQFLKTVFTICIWLSIWSLPFFALVYWNQFSILSDIGEFFTKLALVTFGGAYAVLSYLAQDVVNQFGWLSIGEMMDGLGLAESTPGPLILVTEFTGFIAAYRDGGLMVGLLGALITLWVTFVPCFLWIFAGAPYIDWVSTQAKLAGALSTITAAVVGAILNLSIWFALHVTFASVTSERIGPIVLWAPDFSSTNWQLILLACVCGLLLFKWQWSIIKVLTFASAAGWLMTML
ncbi:MAG TPA: chromate transporter [Oceanospirillaceae bacterium]|nr:chromate transporter [Oceanospirillaceae bacterium]